MRQLGAHDRRQVLVASIALAALLAVIAALWFALLEQNNRFGISPDAVLDLGFGNESRIPDDATLSFVDRLSEPGQWVPIAGQPGRYRSTNTACTATYRQGFVDPSDVARGDDRATTLAFIGSVSDRPIDSAAMSTSTFTFLDNTIEREDGADAVLVRWDDDDGGVTVVLARANSVRGSAVYVTANCDDDPAGGYGSLVDEISRVDVVLTHESRPPDLFTPYEG